MGQQSGTNCHKARQIDCQFLSTMDGISGAHQHHGLNGPFPLNGPLANLSGPFPRIRLNGPPMNRFLTIAKS